jgi:hypothetical protein
LASIRQAENRAYSYFENVRFQPSVKKLKIDMLKTSKGSCLDARRRKTLPSLFLKLFSRCFAFIVIFVFSLTLTSGGRVTTLRWRDFAVPLLRERTKVAQQVQDW